MAMVEVTPTEVRVDCDWFSGRPLRVQLAETRLPVLAVEKVRHERAAYPVSAGPRTLFEVRTPDVRLRLAFEHRRRRWLVHGLENSPSRRDAHSTA